MKGEEFLNKLYKDLNLSDEVIHTSKGSKDKNEAVHRYMERLERTHSKAVDKNKLDLLKSLYHKKYVVKKEDIPRYRDKERIINAQKESLNSWLNYLLDENARYPMWAKYWAFQGMLKIGTYNEATGTYQKRSKKTLAPFIEVNPEILARCISMMVDYIEKDELTDDELSKLVESGNFQKLYTMLQKNYKDSLSNLSDSNEGVWITYHRDDDVAMSLLELFEESSVGIEPQYLKLYNSLQGYNTGWCTAGSEEVAKDQILGRNGYRGGNFYVYYTKDKNNEYKVPRIAIRMEGRVIGEIRGVEDGQNLEEGLEGVLERKLKTFENFDDFSIDENLKIVNNMKYLTLLKKKNVSKEQFTEEDIKFIYEVDQLIEGFGWEEDPRIEEIVNTRTKVDDMLCLSNVEDRKKLFKKFDNDIYNELIKKETVDKKTIMELLEVSPIFLYLSRKLDDEQEIVLEAVKKNGLALEYASGDLQNDREIVLEAVKQNGLAVEYVSQSVIGNREIALEAVKQNGLALGYVTYFVIGVRNLEKIELEAVKQNGLALKYTKRSRREDREMVLEAVKQNGLALEYASVKLKKDREIVLEAVKQNEDAFKYADESLRNDNVFQLLLLKESIKTLKESDKKVCEENESNVKK